MPEKITLQDGTEREVLTQEEQENLLKNNEKVEDLQKQLETITKEKADLEEGIDPNWANIRKAEKRAKNLEKQLREKGFSIQEDGSLVENTQAPQITPEEFDQKAKQSAQEVYFNNHLEAKLTGYDQEVKDAIKLKYQKLSAGETLGSIADVDVYLNEAMSIVAPQEKVPPHMSHHPIGAPPNFQNDSHVTNETIEMGKQLGVTQDQLKQGGDVSDLLLNK